MPMNSSVNAQAFDLLGLEHLADAVPEWPAAASDDLEVLALEQRAAAGRRCDPRGRAATWGTCSDEPTSFISALRQGRQHAASAGFDTAAAQQALDLDSADAWQT